MADHEKTSKYMRQEVDRWGNVIKAATSSSSDEWDNG
jgi:hypothetical protein